MQTSEFEEKCRALWTEAASEKAKEKPADLEALVITCIGLAYGAGYLDQDPRVRFEVKR